VRIYHDENVLDAARRRVSWIFDQFDRVSVSISSGKDSTVLAHLASQEADRRGRTVEFFFLDQEAEYDATIQQVRKMMAWPAVVPRWYQVPIRMTNATSYQECFLNAWHEGEKWMRPKEPESIHEAVGAPDRFYPFFRWHEEQNAGSAVLIGLRAEEVTRYRAVTENAAIAGIPWSSRGSGVTKFYPIYDWAFEDIWLYFSKENVPYNRVYDWLWMKGRRIPEMRVSNLIHEVSFECLELLQEFEPATYAALVERLGGVSVAARYAKESTVFQTHKKPKAFPTWMAYRDFLLTTIPEDIALIFRKRFAGHEPNEPTHRQQVRQILTNDWENNRPVKKTSVSDPLAKWREIL